jgi:hypothetical protein
MIAEFYASHPVDLNIEEEDEEEVDDHLRGLLEFHKDDE